MCGVCEPRTALPAPRAYISIFMHQGKTNNSSMVQSDVMIIINMDVLWAGVTNYNEHFHALALLSVKCALVECMCVCDICVLSLAAESASGGEPHAARAQRQKRNKARDVGCQNGIMLNNNVKLNNHNNTICTCIHLRAVHAHHYMRETHSMRPFAKAARIFVSLFFCCVPAAKL